MSTISSDTLPRSMGRRRLLVGATGVAAGGAALLAGADTALADSPSDDMRLADESRIRRLAVTYALGTDAIGRKDKPTGLAYYNETFTSDVHIMVDGAPSTLRIGPTAWADFVDGVFRSSGYDKTQHLMGTIDVTFPGGSDDGNEARMSSYLHATHHKQDGTANVIVLGTYIDRVVRDHGAWRIATRTLFVMTAWVEKLV